MSEAAGVLFQFDDPSMPVFNPARCETKRINHFTASQMVNTYHYAHRTPSIVAAIGMYVDRVLAGCITYGIPAVPNVQRACGEENRMKTLELNRLFIHDWAGRNSESWLVGQSFRWLRQCWPGYAVLVSYADESAGHLGRIYQATNWIYTGQSREGCEGFNIGGVVFHARTMNDRHDTRSVAKIQAIYPDAVAIPGQPKHRYVYLLGDKRERRELRKQLRWPVLPYPKIATTENRRITAANPTAGTCQPTPQGEPNV